ncbi:MAG: DNA circularization N-terminal domain-containing protein, partial [Gammaproteobacteria bacterium]
MALIDELSAASYKGAPFLVNSVSTSGGRKTVQHEFPNSNIQVIEDLGLLPREYRISAIIAEPDYIKKRNTLLKALEGEGKGVLIHPFYGRVENIVAKTFTLNESVSRLGDTVIEIVFAPSETDGLPAKIANTDSQVAKESDKVKNGVIDDILEFFGVTDEFVGNFKAAVDKVEEIADKVQEVSRAVQTIKGQIDGFTALVTNFKANAKQLVKNPAALASSLSNIISEVPKLYSNATEQTEVLSGLFGFGDDDPVINPTT